MHVFLGGDKSRYVEATREFNKILLYILKFKQYHQKSPQYDQILKKNEQMYALLAICLSLCPQNKLIDENVSTQLKEKYNDKMTKMQRYDDEAYAAYDELFSYACPKFITPSPPVLDQPLTNYNQVILPHNVAVRLPHQYIFVL
jgi:translation initiation factor 3 subunit L